MFALEVIRAINKPVTDEEAWRFLKSQGRTLELLGIARRGKPPIGAAKHLTPEEREAIINRRVK